MQDENVLSISAIESPWEPSSRLTLAAYLMIAGILHRSSLRENCLPPQEDLLRLGFANQASDIGWEEASDDARLDIRDIDSEENGRDEKTELPEAALYDRLLDSIQTALRTGRLVDSAIAITHGLKVGDPTVRSAALCSALDIFKPRTLNFLVRLSWYEARASELTEDVWTILTIIALRYWRLVTNETSPSGRQETSPPDGADGAGSTQKGLMLIHGTVLPLSRSNRPTWSVPGIGDLFKHIQTKERPGVYALADYFRWEGGYTDYAREVAALNLRDWLNARSLMGIDAVAHSHGCNVLMHAREFGARFGRKLLLSCPVDWKRYQLPSDEYQHSHSVRTRFDLAIAADRSAQRFPKGTISEHVLPVWFSHSYTTKPDAWVTHDIGSFIR